MDRLTEDEKEILAQALVDYREGLEAGGIPDIMPERFSQIETIITSIEKKLEL